MYQETSSARESDFLDVDQKLRFFAALESILSGKYPSNDQVIAIIDRLAYLLPMAQDGRTSFSDTAPTSGEKDVTRLVSSLHELLAAKKAWLNDKNQDDIIQDLLSQLASLNLPKKGQESVNSEKDRGKQTISHARTILRILTTNSEARKLLLDLRYFAREMLANIIQHEADAIRPKPHEMAAIDRHAAGWDTQGKGSETLDRRRMEDEERTKVLMQRSITSVDVPGAVGGKKKKGKSVDIRREFARKDIDFAEKRKKVDEELQMMQREINGRVLSRLTNNMSKPPQAYAHSATRRRDIAKSQADQVPEAHGEELVYRVKKILAECQGNKEYQESMTYLLNRIDEYSRTGLCSPDSAAANSDAIDTGLGEYNLTSDPTLQEVLLSLTTLFERVASGKRVGLIFIAIDTLFIEAHADNDFWTWFSHDLFPYVRKLLLQPGYILKSFDDPTNANVRPSPPKCPTPNPISLGAHSTQSGNVRTSNEAEEDGRRVREAGFKFYGDRYFQQFEALREVVVDWVEGFLEDEANDRLWEATRRVWRDLLYSGGDEQTGEGAELVFKRQMWAGVVKAFVPILVAQVDTIPIPRIELSTPTFDLVLENILLKIDALLPTSVALEAHNSLSFSPYSRTSESSPKYQSTPTSSSATSFASFVPPRYTHYDERRHEFKIKLEGIYIDVKDVGVFMRKKKKEDALPLPVPKKMRNRVIEESLVDLAVVGEGITAIVHMVFDRKATDPRTTFAIKDVHVSIPDVQVVVRDLPFSRPIIPPTGRKTTKKENPDRTAAAKPKSKSTLFVRARGKSVLRRTLKPIAVAIVKRKMKKALEEGIRDGVTRLVDMALDSTSNESVDPKHEMEKERGARDERSWSTATLGRLRHSGGGLEGGAGDGGARKKIRVVLRKDEAKMRWANWDGGWVHRIRELMEGPFQRSAYGKSKGEDKWRSNAFSISKR